jgi:DNA-binding CsgD family transcriptional regulator/catechol 2,3-dioxygenase-like lactoylglutathione lyase family enzyme
MPARYATAMPTSRPRGRPPHDDILTPAEWRVVDAVRHGRTNAQIAAGQRVSLDAVKYHVANALAKLGLADRRALRRWRGIRNDSRLATMEKAMEQELKIGSIGQIARTVKDIDAARAWYGETLGLTHLYSFGNLAFFDCGGVRLFLSQGDGDAAESILYFQVDDVRMACEALTARGIAFTHAPHMIHRHEDGTEEWMAFFEDNERRPLGIMSQARG